MSGKNNNEWINRITSSSILIFLIAIFLYLGSPLYLIILINIVAIDEYIRAANQLINKLIQISNNATSNNTYSIDLSLSQRIIHMFIGIIINISAVYNYYTLCTTCGIII